MSIRVGGSSPPITITDTTPVASQAAMLALTAQRGDIAIRTDFTPARAFILTTDDPTVVGNWTQLAVTADAVTSVDGQAGAVSLSGQYATPASAASAVAAQAAADALAYAPIATPLRPAYRAAEPVTTMVANASVSGHGWTTASGTVSANDTTVVGLIGSQTVKMTTTGSGGITRVDKTGLTLDMTGKCPVVWLTIDDPTKVQNISLYLGVTGLASYFQWDVERNFDHFPLAGVPTKVTLPWSMANSSGTPDRTTLAQARIAVQDASTGAVNVWLAGVGAQAEAAAGVAVFTWDDGWATQVAAQQVLDRYAMPASYYPILDLIPAPGVGGSSYMPLTQFQSFQAAGSEICAHAATAAAHNAVGGFTSLSAAALEVELKAMRQWSVDNGFIRGMDHFAYPQGLHNTAVVAAVRRYFATARTTLQGMRETLPPADALRIRCRMLDSGTTLAVAKTYVDVAKASKSVIVFGGHKIGAAADSLTWTTADLTSLTDYIATQGVTVKTMSAALR